MLYANIKVILNEKKRAFRAGNREEVRTIQGEQKMRIREAKEKYRKKLETPGEQFKRALEWNEDNHWLQNKQQQKS